MAELTRRYFLKLAGSRARVCNHAKLAYYSVAAELAPDEEKFCAEGEKEVEEEIEKIKSRIPGKNRPTIVTSGPSPRWAWLADAEAQAVMRHHQP